MTSPARRIIANSLFALALALGSMGCSPPTTSEPANTAEAPPSVWFADVTAEWGLEFTHDAGPVDNKCFMPQLYGSGAALFDFDNDGRLDIYLLQFGGPNSGVRNALFRQLPTGKFQNVSKGSGLDIDGHNCGVAIGDVNNDGWLDVLVAQYMAAKLFLNRGNGTFEDVTEPSRLCNPSWGPSASFVDYDRDGWLDLMIANSVDVDPTLICKDDNGRCDFCHPDNYKGSLSRLFRNCGQVDGASWGGFEDVTEEAGLDRPGPGLGVLCADLSGDGWPDLLVANDNKANHLWVNQRNGTFRELAVPCGVAYDGEGRSQANMGVACGDVDGNGLLDVFITHIHSESHGLWKQESPGLFQERARVVGLGRTIKSGTGWGTTLTDFDHNGELDLALVNGSTTRESFDGTFWEGYVELNQLYTGYGAGRFHEISDDNQALCGTPNVGRGLCVGDIDGDGAMDLLVTQVAGPARILRNIAPRRGHWLMVRAMDPALKRDAIGAEVRVLTELRQRVSLIQPGQSFQCSNDPRAHFGLGAEERVEAIEVRWPDGGRERFACPTVDCHIEVQRGKGRPVLATEESHAGQFRK